MRLQRINSSYCWKDLLIYLKGCKTMPVQRTLQTWNVSVGKFRAQWSTKIGIRTTHLPTFTILCVLPFQKTVCIAQDLKVLPVAKLNMNWAQRSEDYLLTCNCLQAWMAATLSDSFLVRATPIPKDSVPSWPTTSRIHYTKSYMVHKIYQFMTVFPNWMNYSN